MKDQQCLIVHMLSIKHEHAKQVRDPKTVYSQMFTCSNKHTFLWSSVYISTHNSYVSTQPISSYNLTTFLIQILTNTSILVLRCFNYDVKMMSCCLVFLSAIISQSKTVKSR